MSYVNPRFRLPLGCRQSCEPPAPERQFDGKLEVIYCVGGVVSPVLANVYLHYVLDLWFERRVRKANRGQSRLFRFADDFVCCFDYRHEASAFERAVKERIGKLGMELELDKTQTMRIGS